MRQILILESDEAYAEELASAIRARGEYEPVLVETVREACLRAAEQPDLAFIPLDDAQNVIRSLHSLAPGLPIVVLLPEQDAGLPGDLSDIVHDAVVKTDIHNALPGLLEGEPDSPSAEVGVDRGDVPEDDENISHLAEPAPLLQRLAQRERVLAALLSDQRELQGYGGMLDDQQLEEIHARVMKTWRSGNTGLLQFIRLRSRSDDLMLYTMPAGEGRLLTLVARPDLRLDQARRYTSGVVEKLGGSKPKQEVEVAVAVGDDEAMAPEDGESSFALVWRPQRLLPGMLQIALRRSLERIAEANGYELRHLLVDAQLVHVVVTVPTGTTSASLVHVFKQAAEAEIRQQFGVGAQLWAKGYYAAEGDEPLSDAELRVFLGSTAPA